MKDQETAICEVCEKRKVIYEDGVCTDCKVKIYSQKGVEQNE